MPDPAASIRKKIMEGDINEAIQLWIGKGLASDLEKELIVLNARFSNNQRQQRLGVIDAKEYNLVENQVIYGLLDLMDQPKIDQPSGQGKTTKESGVKKLAFLEANPLPERNLFSNVEFREIEGIVRKFEESLSLSCSFGLSLERFMEVIRSTKPDMVHVSAFSTLEGLIFHDKNDEPRQISNELFLTYMDSLEEQPGCIFFNTFIDEALAKNLSQKRIFVMGANDLISSSAAIEMATGFYTAIGFRKSYEVAYQIGLASISVLYQSEVPKLFAYNIEGKL